VTEPGVFTFRLGRSSHDSEACELTVDLAGEVVEYQRRSIVATRVDTTGS
jgi:hypothetical protein